MDVGAWKALPVNHGICLAELATRRARQGIEMNEYRFHQLGRSASRCSMFCGGVIERRGR